MSAAVRHQRAVARTLGFAQEAAARRDFDDALEWLGVVEIVDQVLPGGGSGHAPCGCVGKGLPLALASRLE